MKINKLLRTESELTEDYFRTRLCSEEFSITVFEAALVTKSLFVPPKIFTKDLDKPLNCCFVAVIKADGRDPISFKTRLKGIEFLINSMILGYTTNVIIQPTGSKISSKQKKLTDGTVMDIIAISLEDLKLTASKIAGGPRDLTKEDYLTIAHTWAEIKGLTEYDQGMPSAGTFS